MRVELEIIRLLLAAGADLFRPDITGQCPLLHALGRGCDVGYYSALLDLQDDDINMATTSWNCTLLHAALRFESCTADFVKLLIDRGIKVDTVSKYGVTPLLVALEQILLKVEVVDLLLRNGSRVSHVHRGETTLDCTIVDDGYTDVAQLMLRYFLVENPNLDIEDWVRQRQEHVREVFYIEEEVRDIEYWVQRQEIEREVLDDANHCQREVRRMELEIVGSSGRTLLDFLRTYSGSQMRRDGENGFSLDLLLKTVSDQMYYPLYSNIISSKFGHSLLKDKLEECRIRAVAEDVASCGNRETSLNFDCACLLANYLNESDLLNVIMTFCIVPYATR